MSIEYHKGAFACHAIDSVVIGKFCEREPVTPVCLSVVNKDSELFLDLLVNSLCLSIGLWMEHSRGVWCDVQHLV